MKKILLLIAALAIYTPAYAADNAVTVTVGAGVTLKSKDVGAGVQAMQPSLVDTNGNEVLGTVTASPTANTIGDRLKTINTTLGAAPMQATGGTVGIVAGTALIGKAGIDQTTPGTTNGVQDAATGSTGATAPTKALESGGIAQNAEATAVTNGQLKALVTDLVGKLIVLPYSNPENFVSGVTAAMTGTTSTSLIAAPGAGRNYVTQLICTNSHATVGTFVLIQDGSGGTTIYEGYAAAVGGGFSITFPTPLKQPTATTALFVQNVTTGSNVICSGSGYKGV